VRRLSDEFLSQEITAQCPACQAKNTITLKQIKDEEAIVCQGCGETIQLKAEADDIGDLTNALDDLQKSLEDLGDLKITF